MDNKCQWVKANNSTCGAACDGQYCYNHAPLAKIGYNRGNNVLPKPFVVAKPKTEKLDAGLDAKLDTVGENDDLPPSDTIDELRKKWRAELEQEFDASRGKTYSKKDFPQIINGIYFQSIEEYGDYCEGAEFMGRNRKKNKHKHKKGSQMGFGSSYSTDGKSYYVPPATPTKQDEKLQKGWFQRIGAIAHMRYVVYRDDDGWYFAIFMSIWAKEKQDEAFKTLMQKVATTKLPVLRPCEVEGVGQFHATGPFWTFNGADARFNSGGESLTRIAERMKKAADKKYIPPNLRKMAIAATYNGAVWDLIPEFEHERLKKWLADDCPGWHGSPPKGGYRNKTTNWGYGSGSQQKLLPTTMPPTATSQDFKNSKDGDLVWDGTRKRWIKRNV